MADISEAHNIFLQKIASKIKVLRIESGYSSYETFAFDKNINRVQYWRIENGSNITLVTLFKVLEIHDITPEDFFQGIN